MTTYITQKQTEALAHRRATTYVHRTAPGYASYAFVPHTLMDFVRDIEAAAIQNYRDSLVAGVVLPEPVDRLALADGFNVIEDQDVYTADQLRQAIADALEKQVTQWKSGNELRPFHHQASHVNPDYRDGWNACYNTMLAAAPDQKDAV